MVLREPRSGGHRCSEKAVAQVGRWPRCPVEGDGFCTQMSLAGQV